MRSPLDLLDFRVQFAPSPANQEFYFGPESEMNAYIDDDFLLHNDEFVLGLRTALDYLFNQHARLLAQILVILVDGLLERIGVFDEENLHLERDVQGCLVQF